MRDLKVSLAMPVVPPVKSMDPFDASIPDRRFVTETKSMGVLIGDGLECLSPTAEPFTTASH